MNLQTKKGNVPSKDKLPSCSTWFRLKAERKIMVQRKRLTAVSKLNPIQEHIHEPHQPVEGIINPPASEILG